MNKKEYIKAVDKITAPGELLDRIEALNVPAKKKMPVWKTVTVVAACFVAVIIGFSGILGGSLKAGSDMIEEENGHFTGLSDSVADMEEKPSDSFTEYSNTTATSNRKIVKNAILSIRTKNYDTFMNGVKQKIELYEGYIVKSQEYNYDNSSNRNADMEVKIPAEKLEEFIEELAAIGTVTSKIIESTDITDSYIDVESRINALETEEEALLGLLQKAESLKDVIDLQERLSMVRSDLEGMKVQKKSYDGMVAYSGVTLDISEVERVVEGNDTFFGHVKEKLMNNLYDIADFFIDFSINLIAALPYIAIIGVVAAVVIIIVKKIRKR